MTNNTLSTIAFRADLLARCKKHSKNARSIVDRWGELSTAVTGLSLENNLIELMQSSRLSGIVTAVETLLNDTLVDIFVAYPPRIGKKQITVNELNTSGSFIQAIKRMSSNAVNDLAYKSFQDYIDEWQKHVSKLSCITEDQILEFAEIKSTRDLYVHNNGKINEIYERKAGIKARKPGSQSKMPLDDQYIKSASKLASEIIDEVEKSINSNYAHCTKTAIFREMWNSTCCGRLVAFDTQWEITTEPYHRKDRSWGWSSSEKALYDIFLRIFHGQDPDITTKIDYALYRWSPETNEGTVIRSWLETPFYI
jgi:hypothetical protein